MGRLADRAFSTDSLRRAWQAVLASDHEDDHLSHGVRRFAEDPDGQIGRLQAALAWEGYSPGDLTEIQLKTRDRVRLLHVPTVHDRVLARSILDAVTPGVDPVLGPASFAYRPGLGVGDAVQAVARLRDEGHPWVLRVDVDECFPSIPVSHARRLFDAVIDDPVISAVVEALCARPAHSRGRGRHVIRGLPQGCPLSPLLCNLVLADVDADLMASGFPVVRYADDFVVFARSAAEAWEAARISTRSLERLGMRPGADDHAAMSFEEGFTFLGEDFGTRYPPVLDTSRLEDPEQKVLYLGTQGGRVRTSEGRLVVEDADDRERLDVPKTTIGRIVCFGSVGVSAGVRSWAMSTGVDVVFASRRGNYLGSLVAEGHEARADRVRCQVGIGGTDRARRLGRAIVEAKLRNQVVLLQRFGRRAHVEGVSEAVASIRRCLAMLPDAQSPQELMGLEGAAAASYFPVLGSFLPEGLAFTHRTRQPPLDLGNSALSFLYTVLLGECVTALYAAGLDTAFGVLHGDDDRRPSLALDLLEELRPLVVDQILVESARKRSLRPEHARREDGKAGVWLNTAGRQVVLEAYERRMQTRMGGALPGFAGTMRRHVFRQAQRLAADIVCGTDEYCGMSWR